MKVKCALRLALSRLEALAEHEDDPATLVRLSNAIARVSDSIVRALAAHHKLAGLVEKSKLQEEWTKLEEARSEQMEVDKQRQQDRAVWFRGDQVHWLRRLSEVAHQAVEGDYTTVKEFASGLDAYIAAGDFSYPPDRFTLARLFKAAAYSGGTAPDNLTGECVPFESAPYERDPVVQLK